MPLRPSLARAELRYTWTEYFSCEQSRYIFYMCSDSKFSQLSCGFRIFEIAAILRKLRAFLHQRVFISPLMPHRPVKYACGAQVHTDYRLRVEVVGPSILCVQIGNFVSFHMVFEFFESLEY